MRVRLPLPAVGVAGSSTVTQGEPPVWDHLLLAAAAAAAERLT